MPSRITLLGREEKHLTVVRNALKEFQFRCDFIPFGELSKTPPEQLSGIKLVIVDTLPYSEEQFEKLFSFREINELSRIPVLALVLNDPSRLRYKIVGLGVNDYLPVDRKSVV